MYPTSLPCTRIRDFRLSFEANARCGRLDSIQSIENRRDKAEAFISVHFDNRAEGRSQAVFSAVIASPSREASG
jgi:hypothetical protein